MEYVEHLAAVYWIVIWVSIFFWLAYSPKKKGIQIKNVLVKKGVEDTATCEKAREILIRGLEKNGFEITNSESDPLISVEVRCFYPTDVFIFFSGNDREMRMRIDAGEEYWIGGELSNEQILIVFRFVANMVDFPAKMKREIFQIAEESRERPGEILQKS